MEAEQQRIIEEIMQRLQVLNPDRIILFGSRAEGATNVNSDIDLIVVLNKETTAASFKEKMRETVAVRKLLLDINRQVAIDVLVYSKPEWQNFLNSRSSFSRDVMEKGITLQ